MKRALLLLVVAACGGKVEEIGDGTTSTVPAGTATSVPTGTSTSVPPAPPSFGQPAPGDPPKPTSTKKLTAQAQIGGLDRIVVFAADPVADSCIRMHLVSPQSKSRYAMVSTPDQWALSEITRSPGANRCGGGKQPPAAESADEAQGQFTFGKTSSKFFPCTINVHVTAVFVDKPTVEKIDGDNVAIEGCQ